MAQVIQRAQRDQCRPRDDQEHLVAVISATKMTFGDIIDSVWPFEKAHEAMEYERRVAG